MLYGIEPTDWRMLQLESLKLKSPLHPDIYFEKSGDTLFATTMAVFQHDGKWYKRHCLDYFTSRPASVVSESDLMDILKVRLNYMAEECKSMAVPCDLDERFTSFNDSVKECKI